MQQYSLPQFIEKEGNIAFFISFRQFFYFMGAGILCFFLYYFLPPTIFYISAVIIFIITAILAFGMVNGMPILNVIMNSVGFSMGGKDYVWKKKEYPYPFKPIQRTQIKKIEHAPVLQAQASQLKKIKTTIDLKTR